MCPVSCGQLHLGLVALDANGRLLWQRGDLGAAWNSPAVDPDDGTVFIAASATFVALRPENGAEKWHVSTKSWMYQAACAMDATTVYRGDNGGVFYAIDKAGAVKWQFDTGVRGPIYCQPALGANGLLYFTQAWSSDVAPGARGRLYALEATTGQLLWQYEIGWSSSSPALTADTLLACGDPGSGKAVLYAFKGH